MMFDTPWFRQKVHSSAFVRISADAIRKGAGRRFRGIEANLHEPFSTRRPQLWSLAQERVIAVVK